LNCHRCCCAVNITRRGSWRRKDFYLEGNCFGNCCIHIDLGALGIATTTRCWVCQLTCWTLANNCVRHSASIARLKSGLEFCKSYFSSCSCLELSNAERTREVLAILHPDSNVCHRVEARVAFHSNFKIRANLI
jgi:hypothetical protein